MLGGGTRDCLTGHADFKQKHVLLWSLQSTLEVYWVNPTVIAFSGRACGIIEQAYVVSCL